MFRAYDTGQRHVLDTWQIAGCGTKEAPMAQSATFRRALIWSIPHGVNVPQNQLALRNVSYVGGSPPAAKLFSFDVGSRDTYGALFSNLIDADGTVTERTSAKVPCRPTVVGSANTILSVTGGYDRSPPSLWFKLSGLDDGGARGSSAVGDKRCDLLADAEFPMWACDRGSMDVGAIEVQVNGRIQTTARTKEVWGRVSHFGDALDQVRARQLHAHAGYTHTFAITRAIRGRCCRGTCK